MKRRRPSPALAVSIIALVVAASGSAYAGTVVTGSDIKNGTIRGVDIKNGSLLSKKLSKGSQRLLKSKSEGGSNVTANPVPAFEVARKSGPENQPPGTLQRVASVTVPAGAYVVTANTVITTSTGTTDLAEALLNVNSSVGATCVLDAAGVTSSALQTVAVQNRQTPATLGMQLTRTVGEPSEFVLKCGAGIVWRASESSIIATKVDTINLKQEE
ncbi:MAG: hypothetical protein ACR2LK_08600 [Solirubrobacteraceae bacterium]